MTDAITSEIDEIEALLTDDTLSDEVRNALHGAQQAMRWALDPMTWESPSQTFYRLGGRPLPAASTKRQ